MARSRNLGPRPSTAPGPGKYYSAQTIERLADGVLARFQQTTGEPLAAPLRAANILDAVFDRELSSVLWEPIPEPTGRTILGGLATEERLIVLNEVRRDVLIGTPGLVNDTVGHELGHWMLHVRRDMLEHPSLPGLRPDLGFSCGPADALVEAGYKSWDERNAHRFMAYLLMPATLLRPAAVATDLRSWPGLYRLRDAFQVSITAVRIRLEELNLVYVDRAGVFYESREEARGQHRLL